MSVQPKDVKLTMVNDGTGTTFDLKWDKAFKNVLEKKVHDSQVVIDSEFLRYSFKKIPHATGTFMKRTQMHNAGLAGTGIVVYPGPTARFLYYGKVMVGIESRKAWARSGEKKVTINKNLNYKGAPERGAFWAHRTWADDGDKILAAAQKAFDKR